MNPTTLFHYIVGLMSNQILAGGFLLMVTGSLLALCRKVPAQAWKWILRRITIEVEITNDDPLFAWLTLWLSHHPYSQRARSLTATCERDEYGRAAPAIENKSEEVPAIIFSPSSGEHVFLYRQRIIWLSRNKNEPPKGGGGADSGGGSAWTIWKRETITLRVLGRSQQAARTLLHDARDVAMRRREKKIEIFIANESWWERVDEKDPRPMNSVFLPDGIADGLMADVQQFLDAQEWYALRGIPYRRGYLFYGLAGTGKTSLISALAGHFRLNLYFLNIAGSRVSDDSLMHLVSSVPKRSIVLLEDVDSAFDNRKKSKDSQNKVTFSGLLNSIDGACSKDGRLLFMTTNCIEKLDSALIRPGRADVHLEFGYAMASQAEAMYRAFFPEADGVDDFGGKVERNRMSMAEVQRHLMGSRDSSVKALNLPVKVERAA